MRIEKLYPMTSARLMVIDVGATLQAAACTLSNSGIGLAVVSDNKGRAAGVLSKSDLIRHLTDQQDKATIATLMSREIVSCSPEDELQAAWQLMLDNRLQNMPVLGSDAKPLGVLDARDALKVLFEQEQLQEHMLANYIAGIGF
jgi:CBS domain-containing protein